MSLPEIIAYIVSFLIVAYLAKKILETISIVGENFKARQKLKVLRQNQNSKTGAVNSRPDPQKTFCSQCGKKFTEGAQFCTGCGVVI